MKRSYSFDERQQVLSVLKAAKERPELSDLTQAQLISLAATHDHPPSVSTVYRWQHEGLSRDQYDNRLQRRGRSSKLTAEQKLLLCGYACFRRQAREGVSLQCLRDFSSTHLHTSLANSTLSVTMHDWGFSSQRAMKRESRLTTQKVVDDAIEFLSLVRSYQYSPDRIIVMDETGLWSNVVAPKTYHFRNGFVIPFSIHPPAFRVSFHFPSSLSLLPLVHDLLISHQLVFTM